MTVAPATSVARTTATMLFKGGPNLIDLLVDTAELRIFVTGPRMLFERLELLTSLGVFDGGDVHRLRELAGLLEGEIHCGQTGVRPAEITVDVHRTGPSLVIGLGPMNIYESALVLRTTTGETFRELLTRLLTGGPPRPFIAALHGVRATGHHEHALGTGSEIPGSGHGHGDHGHH